MGTLFGFAMGYIIGARAGQDGFEEVVRSVRAIRQSEEFGGFVDAMKSHGRHLLREMTGRLAGDPDHPLVPANGHGDLNIGGDHRPQAPW
ncbi:MAG: hypothetical protein QOJ09_3089 [Actinomycetota bacterium]|nr:hypothetical protein [Actinomycetota bacterium]